MVEPSPSGFSTARSVSLSNFFASNVVNSPTRSCSRNESSTNVSYAFAPTTKHQHPEPLYLRHVTDQVVKVDVERPDKFLNVCQLLGPVWTNVDDNTGAGSSGLQRS